MPTLAPAGLAPWTFDRATKTLTAGDQTYPAANNVQHDCDPWPPGTYAFVQRVQHQGDGPGSAYGSYGGLLFSVPGRTGMEIHSGRDGIPDGLGRCGIEHCTLGCIRTIDEAMAVLVGLAGPGTMLMVT